MRRRDKRKAWISVMTPMALLVMLIVYTWPLEAICVLFTILGFFGALVIASIIYAFMTTDRYVLNITTKRMRVGRTRFNTNALSHIVTYHVEGDSSGQPDATKGHYVIRFSFRQPDGHYNSVELQVEDPGEHKKLMEDLERIFPDVNIERREDQPSTLDHFSEGS